MRALPQVPLASLLFVVRHMYTCFDWRILGMRLKPLASLDGGKVACSRTSRRICGG